MDAEPPLSSDQVCSPAQGAPLGAPQSVSGKDVGLCGRGRAGGQESSGKRERRPWSPSDSLRRFRALLCAHQEPCKALTHTRSPAPEAPGGDSNAQDESRLGGRVRSAVCGTRAGQQRERAERAGPGLHTPERVRTGAKHESVGGGTPGPHVSHSSKPTGGDPAAGGWRPRPLRTQARRSRLRLRSHGR